MKLLTPMYLTVQIESIPDAETDPVSNIPVQTQDIQMSPVANMIDLTERGREYTEEELEDGSVREVMKLHPFLAPYKVAVLPLSKKLSDKAYEVYLKLIKK